MDQTVTGFWIKFQALFRSQNFVLSSLLQRCFAPAIHRRSLRFQISLTKLPVRQGGVR